MQNIDINKYFEYFIAEYGLKYIQFKDFITVFNKANQEFSKICRGNINENKITNIYNKMIEVFEKMNKTLNKIERLKLEKEFVYYNILFHLLKSKYQKNSEIEKMINQMWQEVKRYNYEEERKKLYARKKKRKK